MALRVVGPARKETQIERSFTDAVKLGLKPPIRMSGDLEGSPGCTLTNGDRRVTIPRGVIVAERHLHLATDEAEAFGVKDGDVVSLVVEGPRPGTLDGGDVMMVGDHFYVGQSARTNEEGIRQFCEILEGWGLEGSEVKLEKVLHLKTGVNYLEDGNMLVSGEFVTKPDFEQYNRIEIPEDEAYAANCIWVNGTVIVPEGYPTVLKAVQDAGYETITVDTSEYRKLDGGLSCLSLRF